MMSLVKVDSKFEVAEGKTYRGDYFKLGQYEVEKYTVTYENGSFYKRISVTKDWNNRFLPDIYYSEDIFGRRDPKFTIETTAYGALKPEEIKKVIEGYQEALEAVEILTANFC